MKIDKLKSAIENIVDKHYIVDQTLTNESNLFQE